MLWFFLLPAAWLFLAAVNDCYDLQVAGHPMRILRRLSYTTGQTALIYLIAFFVFGRPIILASSASGVQTQAGLVGLLQVPRIIPALFLLVSLPLIAFWRIGYIKIFTSRSMQRRAIIVGAGDSGRALATCLQPALLDYKFVGFIDDDPEKQGCVIEGLSVLGDRYDLERLIQLTKTNEIILAINNEIHVDLLKVLMNCYEHGYPIQPMQLLYEQTLGQIPVRHLGQQWFLDPFNTTSSLSYRAGKRLMDITLSVLGLAVFIVIFPFIALAIYLDSQGPIFYSQERVGKGGKVFHVLKLRSMMPNAEGQGKAVWASRADPRITRLGVFLRRTRLDEVPQLLNVLKGEMSIIGPRPERPQFVAELQEQIPFYRTRLSVAPGLTGWAQIKYGYGSSVEDALIKLQYDLYYIKHQSLMLDLLISLRTINVILALKGT
jgi:exopolysaccharide biosynthesis polyprenyl glycosylphosphotransferase